MCLFFELTRQKTCLSGSESFTNVPSIEPTRLPPAQCRLSIDAHYPEKNQLEDIRGQRMPEGVVEKQPDRATVWIFQEADAEDSEVGSFNSRAEIRITIIFYHTTLLVVPS